MNIRDGFVTRNHEKISIQVNKKCLEVSNPTTEENMNDKFYNDRINEVNFNSHPFIAVSDNGLKFHTDSIIISTGAKARWLNLNSENKYKGYGISACATCDGFFFKDKEVAVI